MKTGFAFGAVLIACTACAHSVSTSSQAIEIADKACSRAFVGEGQKWYQSHKTWRAKEVGDHWEAWTEEGPYHKRYLTVQVPRHDDPKAGFPECRALFAN